jgi:hypothetical protein
MKAKPSLLALWLLGSSMARRSRPLLRSWGLPLREVAQGAFVGAQDDTLEAGVLALGVAGADLDAAYGGAPVELDQAATAW